MTETYKKSVIFIVVLLVILAVFNGIYSHTKKLESLVFPEHQVDILTDGSYPGVSFYYITNIDDDRKILDMQFGNMLLLTESYVKRELPYYKVVMLRTNSLVSQNEESRSFSTCKIRFDDGSVETIDIGHVNFVKKLNDHLFNNTLSSAINDGSSRAKFSVEDPLTINSFTINEKAYNHLEISLNLDGKKQAIKDIDLPVRVERNLEKSVVADLSSNIVYNLILQVHTDRGTDYLFSNRVDPSFDYKLVKDIIESRQ